MIDVFANVRFPQLLKAVSEEGDIYVDLSKWLHHVVLKLKLPFRVVW